MKPATGVLPIRVPVEVIERTKRLAELRGVDRQDIVIDALMLELDTAPELTAEDGQPSTQPATPEQPA